MQSQDHSLMGWGEVQGSGNDGLSRKKEAMFT
jgi:hypothetical protein